MISLKRLRKEPEYFINQLSKKSDKVDFEKIISKDKELRELKTKANDLRSKRNDASEAIGNAKKSGGDASDAIIQTRKLGDELKALEKTLNIVKDDLDTLLYAVPNIPSHTTPDGKDEKDNVVIREWGIKPKFEYEPKDHIQIGDNLGLFDFKRGAKIAGSGFPLYTGRGAKLERALINAMVNHHEGEYGFKELFPPVLMVKKSMITTGQLPKFEEDMYHTELDNLYLAPTAEVPITNIHRDEILDESDLPLNYVAYSPCFRRESGSYGKDTRGLLRVHQFNKVELVKFVTPESSYNELESLTKQAESILKILGIHYRLVELCTKDLSFSAAKCYDLEIWAPGEQQWLEVSSCSNFEAFQARRGNIRYRRLSDNKIDYVHTLNGSGLATPRLMVALIETYQKKDGTIEFPDNVADFLGLREID